MRRLRFLAAFVIVAVVVFLIARQRQGLQGDVATIIFGGQTNYIAFMNSDRVTAQRLQLKKEKDQQFGELDSYTHGEPVAVEAGTVQKIKDLLRERASYGQDGGSSWWPKTEKSCGPVNYGVLLSFHAAQQTLRVAFCFNCDDLGVFTEKDGLHRVNRVADFHPIQNELRLVAKSIFPDDSEIQKLRTQ